MDSITVIVADDMKDLNLGGRTLKRKPSLIRMGTKMLGMPWKKFPLSSPSNTSIKQNECYESLELMGATYMESEGVVVNVADQWGIDKLLYQQQRDNVTHLIYGEGYDGIENRIGLPGELVLFLGKTPNLKTLEFRGFWDFTNIPDLTDYLKHFPKLLQLNKLVLPKAGKFLDRMGSILTGIYGMNLERLECSSEFLEGSASDAIMKSIPGLRDLKIFNTSASAVNKLPEMDWKLENLELGRCRGGEMETDLELELCHGIPMPMLQKVVLKFGKDLVKFNYSFPVTVAQKELAEVAEFEALLRKFIPNV